MSYLELARKVSTSNQTAEKPELDHPDLSRAACFPDRGGFEPEAWIPNSELPACNPHVERVESTGAIAAAGLPRGIRLVRWQPKNPPVAIDVCSVVVDVPKFIASELRALDSRLNNPWTIHGGFTVPQVMDRLAQAGVEVELEPKGAASTTKRPNTEGGREIK